MKKKKIGVGNFRFNTHISVGILAFLQCQQSINLDFSCPLNCENYENLTVERNQVYSLYQLCACMHTEVYVLPQRRLGHVLLKSAGYTFFLAGCKPGFCEKTLCDKGLWSPSLKVDNPESMLELLPLFSFPALAYVLDEYSSSHPLTSSSQERDVSILVLWLMPAMLCPGQKEIQELIYSPLTSMDLDPGA